MALSCWQAMEWTREKVKRSQGDRKLEFEHCTMKTDDETGAF
jgi:hypothetical protein